MIPDRELLNLVPRVLRARDYHLYLEGGKRLVDLWLSAGKAILGHKPAGVVRELKNAAERGLFVSFPHPMERRFLKALELFFPGRAFRLYADEGALYRALEKAGFPGSENVFIWRPFLEQEPAAGLSQPERAAFTVPVLPWPLGPAVLVLDKDAEAGFPPGELIPPVLLAPATRALHDLASLMKAKTFPRYPKIEKALALAKEADSASCRWSRRGIYLSTGTEKKEYAALFRDFLEGGFLLPPSPEEPAILPFSMSPGEEAKLAQLLIEHVGSSGPSGCQPLISI